MADNSIKYGVRFYRSITGSAIPPVERMIVATAESFDVTGGAANVNLGPGDLVRKLSTGGVTLANGNETTVTAPYGVVMAVGPYWNGTEMTTTGYLPSDTSWGTILDRQSTVYVCPIDQAIWEMDCDDSSTATTEAAYQALIGENVDFVNAGASGETRAKPRIDISTHATTNTLAFRIVGLSGELQDFSGLYVKVLVRANLAQLPAFASVGAPTLNNTTGI